MFMWDIARLPVSITVIRHWYQRDRNEKIPAILHNKHNIRLTSYNVFWFVWYFEIILSLQIFLTIEINNYYALYHSH